MCASPLPRPTHEGILFLPFSLDLFQRNRYAIRGTELMFQEWGTHPHPHPRPHPHLSSRVQYVRAKWKIFETMISEGRDRPLLSSLRFLFSLLFFPNCIFVSDKNEPRLRTTRARSLTHLLEHLAGLGPSGVV